ncbi:hypothetical protein BJP36_35500 [Moorena producens JHB]|uniref:Uncharacterized protein n=1 Tax=Moorena producens (strain JHB) TaxID=1454205 RepID=A0A9Q9STM0_MOOP1|nr:hypothetical protein [Moorena producens]WAN69398.1 hypothetical protein BJP36_35500 [Moorena producens JHB]
MANLILNGSSAPNRFPIPDSRFPITYSLNSRLLTKTYSQLQHKS